jgi:3',5'-nucleoside bisphosphate phosphatase
VVLLPGARPAATNRRPERSLIDLHLHTTASDGLLSPRELVHRAADAGLTTIAVTDHDTVGGVKEAAQAGTQLGVRVVPGIEITAVEHERDVHVLGYFVDPGSAVLTQFLHTQRFDRIRRVREIAARLADLGYGIDVDPIVEAASRGRRSIGRPAVADALVAAGHCLDRNDAFTRLLGRGRPAFVPRSGVAGAAVLDTIHAAGGLGSFAHPGITANDELIQQLAAGGLDAIEVWHSDHSPEQQNHYAALAERLGLARSGGSDYHGDGLHRACRLGGVQLPAAEFARLEGLVARAR